MYYAALVAGIYLLGEVDNKQNMRTTKSNLQF